MSAAAPPPYDEPATLNQLVFALGRRDEPTVALVECASLAKRRELQAQLAARMPEYRYYVLDVTPYSVVSLLRTLEEKLPAEIKTSQPVQWVVHVHGLENSRLLSQDGQLVPSPLTAQLNLERERLFRSVPYLIVLWGDADFFRTLQREAPDFWHWVTYRFRFEDHTARPVSELPPLPPERLPERGNVAERRARIAELTERYERLALDDVDKKRLLKDKIDILSLLGAEYAEAFMYAEAGEAYRMAIALQARFGESSASIAKLWYNLGAVYLRHRRFSDALVAYETCKNLSDDNNMHNIYHQLGMVYEEQEQWKLALEQYEQAIVMHRRKGYDFQIGNTYHQIGWIFQAQQQWMLALENYGRAIEIYLLEKDTSRVASNIAGTYHQIGRVYEEQSRWATALENYQQALKWRENEKDGFDIGGTYYQIGEILQQQKLYSEAISWLGKAVKCFIKYGHPFLPHAEDALAKTRLKLQQASQAAGETSGPDETR